MEQIIEILGGFLTPFIAIVAVYIAWQQWQTNALKLKLELFDRRYRIYEAVQKILRSFCAKSTLSLEEIHEFHWSVSESEFLFGPEIPNYLKEIVLHGKELYACNKESQVDDLHSRALKGLNEEREWFTKQYENQFEVARTKFKKYLDVGFN